MIITGCDEWQAAAAKDPGDLLLSQRYDVLMICVSSDEINPLCIDLELCTADCVLRELPAPSDSEILLGAVQSL